MTPSAPSHHASLLGSAMLLATTVQSSSFAPFDPFTQVATRECPLDVPYPLQPHAQFGCPLPLDGAALILPEHEQVGTPADLQSQQVVGAAPPLPLLPLHDAASEQQRARGWSPWTHAPVCLNTTRGPDSKYCVFTNSRHGIGGISIVTTPQAAAANVDILNERLKPAPRPRSGKGDNDTAAADASTGADDAPPYRIVPIPGKGVGVVATRRIAKHEAIMTDYAVLVVSMGFPIAVRRVAGYGLLRRAATQLRESGGEDLIMNLDQSSSMAEDEVEAVLRTNAFHAPLGGEEHMALYPEVSRINHACSPNAFTRFMPNSLSVTVAAGRDIEEGEEISISYLVVGKGYAERAEALQRWEFKCGCSLCSLPEDERAASDERRASIAAKRDEIPKAFEAGDAFKAIRLTEEMLELARQEELWPVYSELYDNLARIYWAIGNKREAVTYTRLSLKVLKEQGYVDDKMDEELQVAMLIRTFAQDLD